MSVGRREVGCEQRCLVAPRSRRRTARRRRPIVVVTARHDRRADDQQGRDPGGVHASPALAGTVRHQQSMPARPGDPTSPSNSGVPLAYRRSHEPVVRPLSSLPDPSNSILSISEASCSRPFHPPSCSVPAAIGSPSRCTSPRGSPASTSSVLPDESIRESRDRVRAAVMSAGVSWPDTKVTVNLAPSQQRKSGSGLDLAIAVGVLAASGRSARSRRSSGLAFVGELGLDGSIRPIPGVAPMAGVLADLDIVVPVANAHEAWVVSDARVRPVAHLGELLAVVDERAPWPDHDVRGRRARPPARSRPRRRGRPADGAAGARDRCRGWSSLPVRRLAGVGQDHARRPASRAAAARCAVTKRSRSR